MKKQIIFGTDWWTDCDDAVALRLITRFVKDGKIDLLGIVINACMEHSVASVKAFLNADGLENIPLGIDLSATNFGGTPQYQKHLAESCPGVTNNDADDAVRLYRKLIAQAEGKVEIIEVGFLQAMSALLKSEADDISPLSGKELVEQKVAKMWVMAGKWDADGEKEHNFCLTPLSRLAGKQFCELCPVPVTFLGWEVSYDVLSGGKLDKNDSLYRVLCDHGSANGRSSWDPMTVLLALIGDEEKAGYTTVRGTASVDEEDGANHFREDPNGNHLFVVKAKENAFYSDRIDEIIKSTPS